MNTTTAMRLLALTLVSATAGLAGCGHDSPSSRSSPPRAAIDNQAVTREPHDAPSIALDQQLGDGLHLTGLRITTQPDHRSWMVTLYSTALRAQATRPRLWVHAYPQESSTYFPLDPPATFAPARAGDLVTDAFVLGRPGAFNLYAGVIGADGSLGPAVGLGWIGAGDPDTPEYHAAYRFLQEADDTRAAAMLEQTHRVYPDARLP